APGAQHPGGSHQQGAEQRQRQQPRMRLPVQIKDETIQQGAGEFTAQGGQQSAGGAEQGELAAPGAHQQAAGGADGAQQRPLADALVQRGLQAGGEDHQPGGQHEQQDVFDRQGHLLEDAAQLREQGVDLQQGDGGKGPRQPDQLPVLA